jgi:deazaflavin-dependent oxidoreductase (nitroreductase family)
MEKHELDAQNSQVIEEFRATGGKAGGMFEGLPLLLLHHVGAKTGVERINPVAYQRLDDSSFAVFASNNGEPANPHWYDNIRARPEVTIEVGAKTMKAIARTAEGAERDRIWSRQKQLLPLFAEYEQRTTRQIPVVVLDTV